MATEAPGSNLLLADAYEGIQDVAIYVKDLDGCFLMVNAACAAVLGLESDQFVGRTDAEVFPAQGAFIREVDEAVIADGVSRTYEDVAVDGEGEMRVYLTTKAPLRDASGDVTGVIGISTDITARKAVEEQLRQREAALAEAQAVSGVGSSEADLLTGARRWSDELYRIFGVDPEEFEPTVESMRALIHPDDADKVDAAYRRSWESGDDFELEYRIIRPDGETRTVIARARTFTDPDGNPVRMTGAALDITERRRSHDLLEAKQALLNTAQELTDVGSFELDLVADRATWSDGLYRIFGLDPEEQGAGSMEAFLELLPPEDREEHLRKRQQVVETGQPVNDEFRIVRPDGHVRWIESRITAFKDSAGETTRLIGACQDVTKRKAGVQELQRDLQAARSRPLRDPLTHLANRTLALDRLEHAFELAVQGDSDLSVVLIDVDGFKDLNERHGQLLGDSVLLLVAERLRSCTRGSDTVARVGGDEFLVICEKGVIAPEALTTIENLQRAFAAPLELDRAGGKLEITFSIGASAIGDRSISRARQLLEEAEEAMTWARGRGPGRYAQHPGDTAKTNGHRAAPPVGRLNGDPAQTSGTPTVRSPAEELLRRMYEMWGSDERDPWISTFHEGIEYIPSVAVRGFDPVYRGHEGMRRLHSHLQQSWESIEVLVLSFEERGDHFVVFLLASAVTKGSGANIEISFLQGGTMRDGLIYRLDSYDSRSEAFEALGAEA